MTKVLRLGEFAEVGAGNSAPQNEGFFQGGTLPFVRTSDVGAIHIGSIESSRDLLTPEGAKGLKLFPAGTILFPKSGASTFLNHRVILNIPTYVSSHLATIKANNGAALDRYIFYFLQTVDARDLCQDQAYPSLNRDQIAGIKIPLPSIEEQRKIVEKLDGAFIEVRSTLDSTNQLVEFSNELLASYIQDIYAEREGEITEKLGDLLELLVDHRGKTPKKLGSDFVNTGVRIISAANISKGLIKFERKERFISQSTYEKWMPIALTRGDVILTSEAPLGEVAQVDFDEAIAIGQRLYALRGKSDRMSNDYLRYFLTSKRGKSELRARETGATAIGIRQSELVQLRVPVIPVEMQIERIQLLKQVELLVGDLSGLLYRKIELCNELIDSILSESFAGDQN